MPGHAKTAPPPPGQTARPGRPKSLQQLDRGRLAAATGLRHHHPHRLTRLEPVDAGAPQRRNMDENVLAAVIGQDEAEAARWVIPFDDSVERLGGTAASATADIAIAV